MSFVPNVNNAHVDPAKITYLLSSGKGKFFTQHGFDLARRPEELESALLEHPVRNHYESATTGVHGEKYVVRCSIRSPDGRNPCVLTVWIIDTGKAAPRLVTGYASP